MLKIKWAGVILIGGGRRIDVPKEPSPPADVVSLALARSLKHPTDGA